MENLPPSIRFGKPPANYVAGLSRGDYGFTTRGDIGPAKLAPDILFMNMAQNQNVQMPMTYGQVGKLPEQMGEGSDRNDFSDSRYDAWSGYSAPIFSFAENDKEDKEADEVYNTIEKYMQSRRKEEKLKKVVKKKEEPQISSIASQFTDVKRQISRMNYDE